MIASSTTISPSPSIQTLHNKFLAVLPRIERFRHVRRSQRKQDLLSEMLCLTWKWFVRLAQKGKDASKFVSVLARFAAQAVLYGRRLCGIEKAHDVLSPRAQQRHGFSIKSLPETSHLIGNNFDEALRDNLQTPVPDQVSFRLDFPRWRSRRCRRDRRVMDELMQGERTVDVAQRFGLSSARISQLRREFHQDWQRFCEDEPVGRQKFAVAA